MGFGDFAKKFIGTVADVAQVAAPIVSIYNPAAGAAIGQVGAGVEGAGFDGGFSEELDQAGDFGSSVSGLFGGGGGPLGSLIAGSVNPAQQAVSDYNNLELQKLQMAIDANYANSMQDWQAKKAAAEAGAAARSRAAAAYAAAARQEDANRRRALRRANKTRKRFYNQTMDMYSPYVQAGRDVLPVHTGMVQKAGQMSDALQGILMSPSFMSRMEIQPLFNSSLPMPKR